MWKWKRIAQDEFGRTETFVMEVPGGYVIRTERLAREGRGPDYLQHPLPVSTALVFVPCEPGQFPPPE